MNGGGGGSGGSAGSGGDPDDFGDAGDPAHRITPATLCGAPAVLPADELFDTGNPGRIGYVARSKTRVLSMAIVDGHDQRWRWNLWDPATAMQIASGIADWQPFDFTPSVVALRASGQVELRSVEDGQLLGTVPIGAEQRFGLATDGSYLWGVSATALSVWSATGTPLFDRAGDYTGAHIFAAPGQLQVAGGAAGANAAELIVATDGSSLGNFPFDGTFDAWFLDGKRFITTLADSRTALYDLNGVQQISPSGLSGGAGEYAWGAAIYRLEDLSTPAVPFDSSADALGFVANQKTIAILGDPVIKLFHLDTNPPRVEIVHTPIRPIATWVVGIDESGNWAVGNDRGFVYVRGTETDPLASAYLGCGRFVDIVGTPTGRVAAAVDHRIFVFDAASGHYEGSLPVTAQKLAIMDDGKTIIAQTAPNSLQVLRWPDGATLHTFATDSDQLFAGWSLASAKGLLARTTASEFHLHLNTTAHEISDLTGNTQLVHDDADVVSVLSPNGSRADTSYDHLAGYPCPLSGTHFFHPDGTATAASSPLNAIGWIDDDQVLTSQVGGCPGAGETRIYDALGNLRASTTQAPLFGAIKPISSTRFYAPGSNLIYDVATYAPTWSSPHQHDQALGAIAGPKVVYPSDGRMYAESY